MGVTVDFTQPGQRQQNAFLDRSWSELDAEWEEWITAVYAAIPNAASLALAYPGCVPKAVVCVAGRDH